MSDVVAVALITGASTAAAAIFTALVALGREILRSRGESDRLRTQLEFDERRVRAEAVRKERAESAALLRNWMTRQIAIGTDISYLMVFPSQSEVAELIDERLQMMRAGSPDEISINAVLSRFSDPRILGQVREIHDLAQTIGAELRGPIREVAAEGGQSEELRRLWEAANVKSDGLNEKIANLNSLLEEYVMGADIIS